MEIGGQGPTGLMNDLLDHTPRERCNPIRRFISWVGHFVLWLFVFLPLAWIGMFTVLTLFSIGIVIAIATRLPGSSVIRLLIPSGDYTAEAKAWLVDLFSFSFSAGWKPRPKLTATSPTGEAPTLRFVSLRSPTAACCHSLLVVDFVPIEPLGEAATNATLPRQAWALSVHHRRGGAVVSQGHGGDAPRGFNVLRYVGQGSGGSHTARLLMPRALAQILPPTTRYEMTNAAHTHR